MYKVREKAELQPLRTFFLLFPLTNDHSAAKGHVAAAKLPVRLQNAPAKQCPLERAVTFPQQNATNTASTSLLRVKPESYSSPVAPSAYGVHYCLPVCPPPASRRCPINSPFFSFLRLLLLPHGCSYLGHPPPVKSILSTHFRCRCLFCARLVHMGVSWGVLLAFSVTPFSDDCSCLGGHLYFLHLGLVFRGLVALLVFSFWGFFLSCVLLRSVCNF